MVCKLFGLCFNPAFEQYKVLEAMFQEIKKDASSTSEVASENKVERSSARTRGSASPFRCISSLVQQMNLEKDQELSNAQLQVEELQTLAANRQKEVNCVLSLVLSGVSVAWHFSDCKRRIEVLDFFASNDRLIN